MIAEVYEPVVRSEQGHYFGAALVGTHSVILGWNVPHSKVPDQLMGFAVRRTDLDPTTGEVERIDWLSGQKRFALTDADHGSEVRLDQAPLQRFRWSDYTVSAGRSYRYEVFPMVGAPDRLTRQTPLTFDLCPSQEMMDGVGIYANRGVTAAMAYLQRFQGKRPDEIPDGSAFHWLDRGLKGSLLEFIRKARRDEQLHVCIYEFFDAQVAGALKEAKQRGVRIQIVYHAKQNQKATGENEEVLEHAHLKGVATARKNTGNISHNKFVIHLTAAGTPKRLWTASANFSSNAFYFQTNIGLVFEANDICKVYETYFQILLKDPKRGRKKAGQVFVQDEIDALHDKLAATPPGDADRVLFSPVRNLHVIDTATELIARAKSAIFLSAPFGVGGDIVNAISSNNADILEYGLANSTAKRKIEGLRRRNTRFFTPSRLRSYMGRKWDAKAFGAHKIHAKSLVVDPWGDNPAVLIGSANFSDGSCRMNDENTLLIEGDKRLAAVIATEFLRMYDHYKIRFWINKMEEEGNSAPLFLDDSPSWSDIYYRKTQRSRKFRDREVFSGLR